MNQYKDHKVGDKLYIPSEYHISIGSEDIEGGLATIEDFKVSESLSGDHYNYCFVTFRGFPGKSWNYNYLIENQEGWAKQYKGKIAHACPDIDTPWIEDGDIVDGEVWEDGDIW